MAFKLKIGVLTDSHSNIDRAFGDGNDYMNADLKVAAFKTYMNETFEPDIVFELGDFVDDGVLGDNGQDWDAVNDEFELCDAPRYHALGNHERGYSSSTRADWLTATGHSDTSYSFDKDGFHIIVLDVLYGDTSGGTIITDNKWYITTADLSWLETDLASTNFPIVVFSHITFDDPLETAYFRVENRASVRTILENSGKTIIGCFGGHRHANHKTTTNGIDYYSLYSMVGGASPETAYSALTIYQDVTGVWLVGIDNQTTYGTEQFEVPPVITPSLPAFFQLI